MLWLSKNKLTGPLPAELGQLQRLQSLGLERNQLAGLVPASLFKKWRRLVSFRLDGNEKLLVTDQDKASIRSLVHKNRKMARHLEPRIAETPREVRPCGVVGERVEVLRGGVA